MSITEQELYKLYRIRKTICEMLADRKYSIGDVPPFEEFKTSFPLLGFDRENLTMFATKEGSDEKNKEEVFVFFCSEQRLGIKSIKTYIDRMEKQNISRAILVVRSGISPYAKQILAMVRDRFFLEQFQEAELMVNITQHILVPKHEVLDDNQKKQLLERYKLKETQLPRIQNTDPIARYYGLKKSQVVKIKRPSETAGAYVTYRLVV